MRSPGEPVAVSGEDAPITPLGHTAWEGQRTPMIRKPEDLPNQPLAPWILVQSANTAVWPYLRAFVVILH